MTQPDLLIVAPYAGGHHNEYLRWIAGGLRERGVNRLVVAAPPVLLKAEADVLEGVDTRVLEGADRLAEAGSLWAVGRTMEHVLHAAIEDARPRRVLLPDLDHAQAALALGLRFDFALEITGILLRATLHEPPDGLGERIRRLRKTGLLRMIGRNPHLGPVLALDPDAVEPLCRLGLDARWLPDPVEPASTSRSAAETREALGVSPDRTLAVLFGSIEERKGVLEVLAAVCDLEDDVASRLSVVIVGRTYDDVRPGLEDAVRKAQATTAEVVFQERFVPDDELADLISAADVVLAPYRGHVGSSGVVLRAAAGETPLLATAEGMVGRVVRRHKLGQAIDPDRDSLACALTRVVEDGPTGFDLESATAFAASNTVDHFVDVVHSALFDDPP